MCARVAEVMTADVVSAERTTALDTVAKRMIEHDIGSVIITNDGAPYGIVTESDVVAAGYRIDRPFSEITTQVVASHPLVTIEPGRSVRLTIKRMRDEQVKKLVVVENLQVRGIVTTHDLIDHYGELTQEIETVRERRRRRETSWFDS
ncbi:CBS domain-containing protein [Halobacteria archaeon AArc-dxtr1]|nr:CBS domain-containing protein [Halobacteria archaeon AArc-dxtr1]